MKTIKRSMAGTLGATVLLIQGLPVYGQAVSDQTMIRASLDAGLESVENTANIISDSIDSLTIESTDSTAVYEPEYTPVYTYSEPYVEIQDTSTTMSVDEFLALYGQQEEAETIVETVPVDTSNQEAAYQAALAGYNAALAEYEAANQMIETTREIEVEITEEVTDEEGNVSEVVRTEIQTVTEMVPEGDIVSAQANLDAAKAALDTAPVALDSVKNNVVLTDIDVNDSEHSVNEEALPIENIELVEDQKDINDDITVSEGQLYSSSGTAVLRHTNLTWSLDDDGVLIISGLGDMFDYTNVVQPPWYQSENVKKVILEQGVTSIGYGAFSDCTGLTSITIPDSVTSIGGSAFSGCTGLTSVTIPNSVTNIGGGAFSGCTGLTSVTIPNSVTNIGGSAFYSCTGLTSITIPDSVKNIGAKAFDDTPFINNYVEDFIILENGILYKYKGTESEVIIPDSVTGIADSVFSGCTGLTSVTIPNSVTSIGGSAFSGCTGLTSITIPNSVTNIGGSAFYGCTGLISITIPDSVTSIGSYAFYRCTALTGITIPDSITSIGTGTFTYCRSLTDVTIPNSVTSIDGSSEYSVETGAFESCTSLTNITIPDSVTSLGARIFAYCSNLTSITIPNSVTNIAGAAFLFCQSLTDVYYQGMEEQWNQKNLYRFDETVTIHFLEIPFTDVPKDAWYYSVAKECYETGMINGTSESTFSPMQTMTRAMVVTILWRMDGQPKTEFNNKFKDVSSKQWYATSISWAVNNGVVNGYGDGTFKPDAAVTREQVAVMLANYAGYKKVYKPGTNMLNTYPDGSQVSTWAQQGMKWALTNGIISGDGAGYLRPKKSATRAEGAAMLLRMNNWL